MKVPNEVSVVLTQVVDLPAPVKPIKGVYPWGVGKKYRRCRRGYAQVMRRWKKGPKTITNRIYVPFAQIEMVMARNEEDAEVRRTTESVTAEFTIKPTTGRFFGNGN